MYQLKVSINQNRPFWTKVPFAADHEPVPICSGPLFSLVKTLRGTGSTLPFPGTLASVKQCKENFYQAHHRCRNPGTIMRLCDCRVPVAIVRKEAPDDTPDQSLYWRSANSKFPVSAVAMSAKVSPAISVLALRRSARQRVPHRGKFQDETSHRSVPQKPC